MITKKQVLKFGAMYYYNDDTEYIGRYYDYQFEETAHNTFMIRKFDKSGKFNEQRFCNMNDVLKEI